MFHLFYRGLIFFYIGVGCVFGATDGNQPSVEVYVCNLMSQGHQKTALVYLNHLKDLGNVEGFYHLGILALQGIRTSGYLCSLSDQALAHHYFEKAHQKGHAPSMSALADGYLSGDGVEKNELKAFSLYKRAADLGFGPAQFHLAVLYKNGVGVDRDLDKASTYFKRAIDNPSLGELRQDAHKLLMNIREEGGVKTCRGLSKEMLKEDQVLPLVEDLHLPIPPHKRHVVKKKNTSHNKIHVKKDHKSNKTKKKKNKSKQKNINKK